jgi:hypothetical protein
MKRTVVSYQIKADRIEENTRLLENVFRELEAKHLDGVRYITLQSGDGWYTHFTTVENSGANPITTLDSFKEYVAGVRDRCAVPPHQANDVAIVGNYRMIGG